MIIAPIVKNIEKIISSFSVLSEVYAKPYLKVIKSEIDMAEIKSNDKVLSIGCGAVPFTAVYIAKLTGTKVVAIDSDKNAINKAKKFVSDNKVDHLIDVKHINGANVKARDFTVAFVALQARPKEQIILNLLKTTNNIKIVARRPLKKLSNEYDMLPGSYNYENICFHNSMKTFDASVLYNSRSIFHNNELTPQELPSEITHRNKILTVHP